MTATYSPLPHPLLMQNGLNLQAVFDTVRLPAAVRQALAVAGGGEFRQCWLFGNGGPDFWRAAQPLAAGSDPLDAFARQVVMQFWADTQPRVPCRLLYPGPAAVPLQRLGQLAGWHQDSPLKIGINDHWGLWFAYRVVLVADSDAVPTAPVVSRSPCDTCVSRDCVVACAGGALATGVLALERCVDFRLTPDTGCAETCPARRACPVAPQHRYDAAQIHYHYRHSRDTLRTWRNPAE